MTLCVCLILTGGASVGQAQDLSGIDAFLDDGECESAAQALEWIPQGPPKVSTYLIDIAACFAQNNEGPRVDDLVHKALSLNINDRFVVNYGFYTLLRQQRAEAYQRERLAFLSYLRQKENERVGLFLRHLERVGKVKSFKGQPLVDIEAYEYYGDFSAWPRRRLFYFRLATPDGDHLGDILFSNLKGDATLATPADNLKEGEVFYWADYIGKEELLNLSVSRIQSSFTVGDHYQASFARFVGTERRKPSFNAALNVVINFLRGYRAFEGAWEWGKLYED